MPQRRRQLFVPILFASVVITTSCARPKVAFHDPKPAAPVQQWPGVSMRWTRCLQGQGAEEEAEEAAPLNRREARRAERAEALAQQEAQQQHRQGKQQVGSHERALLVSETLQLLLQVCSSRRSSSTAKASGRWGPVHSVQCAVSAFRIAHVNKHTTSSSARQTQRGLQCLRHS